MQNTKNVFLTKSTYSFTLMLLSNLFLIPLCSPCQECIFQNTYLKRQFSNPQSFPRYPCGNIALDFLLYDVLLMTVVIRIKGNFNKNMEKDTTAVKKGDIDIIML